MSVARHNACDMRSVAVSIVCARVAGNKALAINDARSQATRLLQVIMAENTAIDDRYADSGAIESILLACDISLNRRNVVIGSNFVRAVRAYVRNVRMVLQPRQHSDWNAIGRPIDVIERKPQPSTLRRHFGSMRLGRLFELNDDAHCPIDIQREISKIGGELLMAASGFGVLCSSRSWNQNEDRHCHQKQELNQAETLVSCKFCLSKFHVFVCPGSFLGNAAELESVLGSPHRRCRHRQRILEGC